MKTYVLYIYDLPPHLVLKTETLCSLWSMHWGQCESFYNWNRLYCCWGVSWGLKSSWAWSTVNCQCPVSTFNRYWLSFWCLQYANDEWPEVCC